MKRKRLKLEDRLEIAKRHRRGEKIPALAAEYDKSVRQIQRIIQDQTAETAYKRENHRVVSFRAPESEIEAFLTSARSVGIEGSSNAFRALLRLSEGQFEVFPVDLLNFVATAKAVNNVGRNLNQLTRRVHTGQLRLTDDDREMLNELISIQHELRRELHAVKNQFTRRRGYAIKHLVKMLEERAATEAE